MSQRRQPDTEVIAERLGSVLLVTLQGDATRNALGPGVYEQILALILQAEADSQIGSLVLAGAGRFFSSGGNVRALRDSAKGTLSQATGNTDRLNRLIRSIVACRKPVIAAVEGGAAGAGFSLVLACDLVVASDTASFSAAHVRVGLSPDGGATYFLRAALPRQLVMEICMLGQPVSAARLAAAGVVNRVVAEGTALRAALALAQELADGPPGAIATIKHLINAAPGSDLPGHLEAEAEALNLARFGPEASEGLTAFLEKRPPRFRDAT